MPASPPPSFQAALLAALDGNTALSARVPGGWWHKLIPPGTPVPAATFLVVAGDSTAAGGPILVNKGQLQLNVYGRAGDDVASIADAAAYFINDLALAWDNGRVMELRIADPSSPALPVAGPAASLEMGEVRLFTLIVQGAFVPSTAPQNPY